MFAVTFLSLLLGGSGGLDLLMHGIFNFNIFQPLKFKYIGMFRSFIYLLNVKFKIPGAIPSQPSCGA